MSQHSSPGDPEGRRLARHQAVVLSEASRVAQTLERLLLRSGVDATLCTNLIQQITREEQRFLLRGYGRFEPRNRFKARSSHPLLDHRKPDFLFLDESGKARGGPEPVFALAAVAMSEEAHEKYRLGADALKREFFGERQVTFHEPDMRRHETIFGFDGDVARRAAFCDAVDALVASTAFTAFGVAIRKQALDAFRATESDPYLPWDTYGLAIHLLFERYVDYLAMTEPQGIGRACFESQGPVEDAQHHLEYNTLLLSGTQWIPSASFRNWLQTSADFVPKAGSHGTEIADMLSRDLYEWVRDGCTAAPRRWHIFNDKVYRRGDRRMGKFGFKVFPDSDIRALVEAHRESCGN